MSLLFRKILTGSRKILRKAILYTRSQVFVMVVSVCLHMYIQFIHDLLVYYAPIAKLSLFHVHMFIYINISWVLNLIIIHSMIYTGKHGTMEEAHNAKAYE